MRTWPNRGASGGPCGGLKERENPNSQTATLTIRPARSDSSQQASSKPGAVQRSSKSALGAYFRRMCSHMDKPKAVTAAAHKVARLIYTLLTKGEEYTDQGQDYFEERYRERVIRQITQRAAKLGLSVVPTAQAA